MNDCTLASTARTKGVVLHGLLISHRGGDPRLKMGIFNLFKIGIGPFSSHKDRPIKVAYIFFPKTSVIFDWCNLQPKEIYHA
jgi:hypothetical protein